MGKHKGLLITHLNIRSLWIKLDLVRTTFDKCEIDIITFSEANEIQITLLIFKVLILRL